MGQRHQIYVRMPKKFYNKDNPNNRLATTVGIHHQWLYGITALKLLRNFLTFAQNDLPEQHSNLKNYGSVDILKAAYSMIPKEGYYCSPHILEDECKDPRIGDNNDGITVIDIEDGNISYCLLSLDTLETIQDSFYNTRNGYVNFYPISAERWFDMTITNSEWKKFKLKATVKENQELDDLRSFFKDIPLLTTERLIQIFPSMKDNLLKGQEEHEKLKSNAEKFIKNI